MKNIARIAVAALAATIVLVGCRPKPNPPASIPKWNECTLSSNWHGSNASQRMMNILSPRMPDEVFEQRLSFIKSRGCNTAHVFVCNKADGEYAGYSIYGKSISWNIDKAFADKMTERIKRLRSEKLGVVLWLVADDCGDWNSTLAKNFGQYVKDIKSLGWFDMASTVVLGLELDEYWTAAQVNTCMIYLRGSYGGMTGVHMTSGKYDWVAVADILFYQTDKGKTASQIKGEAKKVISKVNKPVNFFELSRSEDRTLSQAALDAGCFGVGNW